jgi:hypothetical protein
MTSCPVCEGPMPPSKTRPRIYCSHNCRQYAWSLERRVRGLTRRLSEAQESWERLELARGAR